MSWFTQKRPRDPISERARTLSAEIAALEEQIQKLNSQAAQQPQPRLRSTALPHRQTLTLHSNSSPAVREPIFEDTHKSPLNHHSESLTTPQHFNDLGVRKYDVVAAWRRLA